MPILFRRRSFVAFAALVAVPFLSLAPAHAEDVTVFAADSLKNALDEVAATYMAETGQSVLISYAASNALAKQIEEAAPADIFFSADLAWMDYLEERNLIQKDTRVTLLGNEIVLVAPADSTATLTIGEGMDLVSLLGADGRLAMANVDSEPAGKYGRAALENLGVWPSVADRIVQAKNVRAALALVAKGRGAARYRLPDRCEFRAEGKGRGHVPHRQPPRDPLPCGDHRLIEEPGCENVPQLHDLRQGQARL